MKLFNILSICSVALLSSLVSCSDDDDAKTPLASVKGSVENVAYTSISYEWSRVEGALQYGYEFSSADGSFVESGVTQDTNVVMTGLTPATEYVMNIVAFPDVKGSYTSSEPLVLTATTLAATSLDTPQLDVDVQGRYANVSWAAVPNAAGYSYELIRDAEILEEGTVDEVTLQFAALDPGAYTLTVIALTPGEAFTDSEKTVNFEIEKNEIWRVTGTYTSSLIDGSWPVTMVAYSDDSYELIDFYQTADKNLSFFVDKFDSSAPYKMSASEYEYDSSTLAYAIPVGRSGLPVVYVYPSNSRFTMSGDKNGGTLVIAVKVRNASAGSAKRDQFVWGSDLK